MGEAEMKMVQLLTSPVSNPIKVVPFTEIFQKCKDACRNPNMVRVILKRWERKGYAAKLDGDSYCLTVGKQEAA